MGQRAGWRPAILGLALVALTTLVFWPTLWNGFVWDDDINFTGNPHYRGLGGRQLVWMLTTTHSGHYIPITWLTFGLDYVLWGLAPFGYHLGNLIVHVLTVLLVWRVAGELLRRGTGLEGPARGVAAVAAAAFFAVHPLRVESVAWVTERRDLLSGLFFLATVLAYLRACEATGLARRRWLALSVGAHALALGAKAIVMTAPILLLLLDVYPLGRLPASPRRWLAPAARGVVAEKLPYLALSTAAGLMAMYAQLHSAFLVAYPWPARLGIAVYTLWFYVRKTLLPVALSPLYEVPVPLDLAEARFSASALGVVAVTIALVGLRRRWPAGLASWVYYGIVLFPLTGLVVRAGFQLAADRYSYLACLPWAILFGAMVGAVWRAGAEGRAPRALVGVAAVAVAAWLVALAGLTWQLGGVWRDPGTLWGRAVAVDPGCARCQGNLGAWLMSTGRPGEGLPHLEQAVAARPDLTSVRVSLGLALARLRLWPEAIAQFETVTRLDPEHTEALNNLGVALMEAGRPAEALLPLQRALAITPADPGLRLNLGLALARLGRPAAAIEQFEQAVALRPRGGMARLGLVQAYLALGRVDRAWQEQQALEGVDPSLAAAAAAALGAATAGVRP